MSPSTRSSSSGRTPRTPAKSDKQQASQEVVNILLRLNYVLTKLEAEVEDAPGAEIEPDKGVSLKDNPGTRVDRFLYSRLRANGWASDIPYWKSFLSHARDRSQKGYLHTFGWHIEVDDRDMAQAHVVIRLLYVLRTSETELGYRLFKRSDTLEQDEKAILHLRGWDKFYTWTTFGDALELGEKPHPFPGIWQSARLPFSRGLRPPLSDPDSPVEELPYAERLQPDQMFDARLLLIDREGRIITFAHTQVDQNVGGEIGRPVIPANRVEYYWLSNDNAFTFSDTRMEELYQWVVSKQEATERRKQRRFEDNHMSRVSNHWLMGTKPVFELQPTRYFRYVVSNQLVQIGARFKGGPSILDVVIPSRQGVRRLPTLQAAQVSNHLGVTAMIITHDGYIFMYVRGNTDQTDPGTTGFVASTALRHAPHMRPETFLASSEGFKRELNLEASDFLPAISEGVNLLYVGTLREWARAGKPEMYFLARSKLTLEQHINWLKAGGSQGKVQTSAVRTESDYFRLVDPLDPIRSQRSIFFLLERAQELSLQEAAKGGLYLLYMAYERAKHGDTALVDYLAQVP